MQTTATLGRVELLRIADTVAQEKGIPADEVLTAMEQAISSAARRKYGQDNDIVVQINRKTGSIDLVRQLEVVEEVENTMTQIEVARAQRKNPAAQLGDIIQEPLPPIDLGRIAAQSAKQVIVQRMREAERERQYEEYKDRIGEIVVGEVKRIEHDNVLVDLGRGEAMLRREELINRERFNLKDRVRAYLYDVRHETRGPQLFLSRTHPQFLAKLFAQEVPEIYDGIIEIKAVARDPGSRAKMAVISKDSGIDPVGACVGMRGSRVQAVVSELGGEKIDIIPWSPDPATFVVNALAPAEVTRVVLDPENQRIEVVVPDQQQNIAIGRRGQNVRLATQLTGWDIDIISETEDSDRRNRDFRDLTDMFVERLNVDEVIAQLLVTEGYASVEDIAYGEQQDLAVIEGFDEEIAEALIERAQETLIAEENALRERAVELGVTEDLLEFERLPLNMIVKLGEKGVKTLDDFADLAADEMVEMLPESGLDAASAGEVIMAARVACDWFDGEDPTAQDEKDGEDVVAEATGEDAETVEADRA